MPHYSGDTVTIDAQDLVDDLLDEQDRITAEADRIGDEDDDWGITDSEFVELADDETADEVSDAEFREVLTDEYRAREHQIDELETKFHEWSGSKFTIKHLTAGDDARIGDWVSAKALQEQETDVRTQSQAARIITVAVGVVNVPGEASVEKADGIGFVREHLPSVLVRWLYDKINNLRQYGEVDLDDFTDLPPSLVPDSGQNS